VLADASRAALQKLQADPRVGAVALGDVALGTG
jgi:hypothetical protein